jgi:hypothetical protein
MTAKELFEPVHKNYVLVEFRLSGKFTALLIKLHLTEACMEGQTKGVFRLFERLLFGGI